MKYVYPAIFRPEDDGFCVFFPDIKMGATQGDDMVEAMEMAEDFLCGALYKLEELGEEMPIPSDIKLLEMNAGDISTLVFADVANYKRKLDNREVKKTLSLPMWLNSRAEEAKINFSQILQKALKSELQIAE